METRSNKPYVLHIEDDDGDAYLVVRALAQSPCDVRIGRASDGREALAMLQEMGDGKLEKPALIVLDWKLPLVSGLEVLQHLRRQPETQDIPVAVFTSSEIESDREAAETAGAAAFYVKPIEYSEFRDMVRVICERFLLPLPLHPASSKAMVL